MSLFGKEPKEVFVKGRKNLEGNRTKLVSIIFKWTVKYVTTSLG